MSETHSLSGDKSRLIAFLEAPMVTGLLTWLIIGNAFTFGLLTYSNFVTATNARYGIQLEVWLGAFDNLVLTVFTVELIARIFAFGRNFFKDGWNVFDAVIVAASLLGQLPVFTVLRIFRVLRLMRLLNQVKSLRMISSIIFKSLTGCVSISFLMLVILFIFALAGHALFGATHPDLFGELHTGMYTLFSVAALYDLEGVASALVKDYPYVYFFLLPYFLMMSYVVLNFFGGIIIYYLYEFSFEEVKTGKINRDEPEEPETVVTQASEEAASASIDQYQALMQELSNLRSEVQELKRS